MCHKCSVHVWQKFIILLWKSTPLTRILSDWEAANPVTLYIYIFQLMYRTRRLSEWGSFQSAQKKTLFTPFLLRKLLTLQDIALSSIKVKLSVAPAGIRELVIILLANGQTGLRFKARFGLSWQWEGHVLHLIFALLYLQHPKDT